MLVGAEREGAVVVVVMVVVYFDLLGSIAESEGVDGFAHLIVAVLCVS